MSARRTVRSALAGVAVTALAGSALALTSSPAHAAVDADDTTFTPVAADLIGVGSDTSQNALFRLANAYNSTTPAPSSRLATFAATGGGQITLPGGAIDRPNGSGAGKGRLYGANNNADVDYARSSSELNANEINAGLQAFPFALDTLGVAVSGQVASNAPSALTEAQILAIYKGDATTWTQVGGTSTAAIAPKIPQAGSGTRSFFLNELKRINGGVDVVLGSNVAVVQENDAAPLQSDPNAIGAFSTGRAGLLGSALRVPAGFKANRALYNVVRGNELTSAPIQAVFGPAGFVCSDTARTLIEAAGFKQLATAEKDGVCGEATQAKTTDFTINTGPALTDDPTFTPDADDVIGVGSDTSQHALALLADGYNGTSPAPANRLASYAATGGGQIPLPSGAIDRPNGSGAGKGRLYGANNNADVDYARSSSELNANEINAGLQAFPFALDTLGVAVSGSTPSNAPTALTEAQILAIYKGDATTWTQVGGTSTAAIAPKIPQAGSGTRSFFLGELKRINGGVDVVLGSNVAVVQENDPAPIQGDANAIAPFSVGRAGLEGTKLRVPAGFEANRALYNVVRAADLTDADVQDIFGADGYVCSDAATDRIEAAGFQQLARSEDGGVCGESTQAKTTNFEVNEPVVAIPTSTTLTAASPAARSLRLTARVTGSTTPTGTVSFIDAATGTSVGSASLIGGTATLTRTVAPGSYRFSAVYSPTADSAFTASESAPVAASVKTSATVTESFPATTAKGAKSAKGVVTVKLAGTSTQPTGRIVVKEGSKTVGTGVLRAGKATVTLQRAKVGAGRSTLVVTWAGDAVGTAATKRFTVTFK